jgi:2-haloacid dehalogenase/putative hydrolase of the HAD superfamily
LSKDWPKAVLLDFFGTVVQEDFVLPICRKIAAASAIKARPDEIRITWSEMYYRQCAQLNGSRYRLQREMELSIIDNLLGRFEADLSCHALGQELFQGWSSPSFFSESKTVLAAIKIPMAVISNIDNTELHMALQNLDLKFNHVITSEDCRYYKPHPEIFRKTLSLLDLTAVDVLFVGDSLHTDVLGAKNAGIPVLWINRKGQLPGPDDPVPDFTASDLNGLIDILKTGNPPGAAN